MGERLAGIYREQGWALPREYLTLEVLRVTPTKLVCLAPDGGEAWFERASGQGTSPQGMARGRGVDWSAWRLEQSTWSRYWVEETRVGRDQQDWGRLW